MNSFIGSTGLSKIDHLIDDLNVTSNILYDYTLNSYNYTSNTSNTLYNYTFDTSNILYNSFIETNYESASILSDRISIYESNIIIESNVIQFNNFQNPSRIEIKIEDNGTLQIHVSIKSSLKTLTIDLLAYIILHPADIFNPVILIEPFVYYISRLTNTDNAWTIFSLWTFLTNVNDDKIWINIENDMKGIGVILKN
jgi:hypothetical protein